MLKLTRKGKFVWNHHLADKLPFFLKKVAAIAFLHTYADQINVLGAAKFCPVLNK